jgi:hypothetical protein
MHSTVTARYATILGRRLPSGSAALSSRHIIHTAGAATAAPSRIVTTTAVRNPADGRVNSTSGPTMNCASETANAIE